MMAGAEADIEEDVDDIQEGDKMNSREESKGNPWPNLGQLFAFKRKKGNNIIMQCKMCLPRRTELSAFKTSTSNLRKHVVVSKIYVFCLCIPNALFIV